jgi:dihydrofolate reductase
MSKLILYIATSLDGQIARKFGEVDWLFTDQDYGYTDFYNSIDRLIMGRNTYDQIQTFGDYPYPDKQSFVFSQISYISPYPYVTFVNHDLIEFVNSLKKTEGQDIWLVGGAKIAQCCLANHLVDKLILSIHPIILGDGIPLFTSSLPYLDLKLAYAQTFATGLVQLTYNRS